MFNHVSVNIPSLIQENVDGVRRYVTPEGKKYPSVTTVLADYGQDSIQAWRARVGEAEANRVSKAATSRGTAVHKAIEEYLHNRPVDTRDMMPKPKAIFHRMKPALSQINNIYCLETKLYSDQLQLAGTVDCIAEYDGVLSVIDFKTSTRLKKKADIEHYFMQCAAYATMFEERTGIAVPKVVVLIGVESVDFPQVMVDLPEKYLSSLKEYIQAYKQKEIMYE